MRWINAPEGANWGEFGPDDRLGRLNWLTPDTVLRAVQEVRVGRTFCLSLPLDYPGGNAFNPRRFPPVMQFSMRGEDPVMCYPMDRVVDGQTDVVCDDRVTLSTQYSTQWDSLAHIGARFDADGDGEAEVVFYNGYRAGEDIKGPVDYLSGNRSVAPPYGAGPLGIDGMASSCVQGRGVMVDLHAHFGDSHQAIGYETLMNVLATDRIVVERGDILCIRTGFDRAILGFDRHPPSSLPSDVCTALDGSDQQLLNWITGSGIVAIAADNEGVEFLPTVRKPKGRGTHIPLHEHCLFKLGIPLGEMFYLSELADWLRAEKRNRFLLTAPPLRLPGAVGSPVTPIATV